jgi:pyruvate,orthophosphate dikinase
MDQRTALLKIPAESIDSLLVPVFDARAQKAREGDRPRLPAGPGAASGLIVFTATAAEQESKRGNRVVLCRMETSPDDLKGMLYSQGILTSRGGVSSHAALVARQLGKVCVCGCDEHRHQLREEDADGRRRGVKEGDYISLDGSTARSTQGHRQRRFRGEARSERQPETDAELYDRCSKR